MFNHTLAHSNVVLKRVWRVLLLSCDAARIQLECHVLELRNTHRICLPLHSLSLSFSLALCYLYRLSPLSAAKYFNFSFLAIRWMITFYSAHNTSVVLEDSLPIRHFLTRSLIHNYDVFHFFCLCSGSKSCSEMQPA